jgi:acetyl esterase/lipase
MTPYLSMVLASLSVAYTFAGEPSHRDIEYARVGDVSLKLDLYFPKQNDAPLIVYVLGGAWRGGSKSDVPILKLLDHGFAIASVDYRLSTQAPFPAQVHDIKAAIRFLRANSERFHINTKRMALFGSSAGGHLAAAQQPEQNSRARPHPPAERLALTHARCPPSTAGSAAASR